MDRTEDGGRKTDNGRRRTDISKQLNELLQGIPETEVLGNEQVMISDISYHSKKTKPGDLFVAINGFKTSGKNFIEEALSKGARAIAIQSSSLRDKSASGGQNSKIPVVLIKNPRRFLALVSQNFFDFPSKVLNLIGITGTNGKTTTAYLVKSIFDMANKPCGLIGTIRHFNGKEWIKAENTTPESPDLLRILFQLRSEKFWGCVLEVSSHSLSLDRVFGLNFKAGVLTNLGHDHLDFHKSINAYKEAKMKLFLGLTDSDLAVLNLDDPFSLEIIKKTKAKVVGYKKSVERGAWSVERGVEGRIIKLKANGMKISIRISDSGLGRADLILNTSLIGEFNLYNILAATAVGLGFGISKEVIKEGIERVKSIPGRIERVSSRPLVFVDYAHTPDALKNLLKTGRSISQGRIIVVFGCGGDRDKEKRPVMGRIATENSDYVILTSDNPRTEDPLKIIDEIKTGIVKENCEVVPDRFSAIRRAIFLAKQNDTVIIAGKGHEDYQIIGEEKRHFDDREVVRSILRI